MTENIEAIVLGYTKFGESSVVVHTLSEEYGRRGFLVHVGKKAGMALLLPMNILEMDVTPNPKSTLWTARNLTAKDPLNGIRSNLYKNTMSLFLSEVLLRTVKDGQAEEGLYPYPGHAPERLLQFPYPVSAGICGGSRFQPHLRGHRSFRGEASPSTEAFPDIGLLRLDARSPAGRGT